MINPHDHQNRHAGDVGRGHPSAGPKPSRLYRNRERGRIFGVCAGLADYFGINPFLVRIAAVIALFMFPPPTIICYLLATLLIDRAPAYQYESAAEKEFWRQLRLKPSESLSRLRHRYREQEQRIRNMEAFVTSSEAKLHRAFRDLDS
ncbi:MAG: envelope stress response membrane protein PspC [Kiloniellaceae bacterium]